MKKFLFLAASLLFVSCSSFKIDRSTYKAKSQNERIRYVVLHYTAIDDEKSIRALTQNEVSSHYLITSKKKDPIYSLVPDEKRAWHAGVSSFGGRTNLNDTSIGIEIVNLGYRKKHNQKIDFIPADWYLPFDQTQIEKVAFLVKELSEKYNIEPKHILGHSDIAPGRKPDPGPKFPWKYLYDNYGIGAWYNHADYVYFLNPALYNQYTVQQIKSEFKKYGYTIEDESSEWDKGTQKVIYAFQSHFRPGLVNGTMDLETFAILKALNKKYK
jgi:N-acetyl-anhydromuramyl-L-alanine amidase AmpD